jgi:16S rRNA (cytidine1402-2'-O)-methyltransferase
MAKVYLIPSLLHEDGLPAMPAYLLENILHCQVFFVENERTARRYLKSLSREIVIDDYEWHLLPGPSSADKAAVFQIENIFRKKIEENGNIGIISEAGCPGVADPGQSLVAIAQQMNAEVKPLVGPNAILLALMASGMNGQQFHFRGYLPIDNQQRTKTIRELEMDSKKSNCTQIFIETPYRNNQLMETILKTCNGSTRLCVAVDITGKTEWIKTLTIQDWQKQKTDIHKRPAIFLLHAHP